MHKITTIGEHAICMDILPEDANILDAGCRGFDIANYFNKNKNIRVINIDIDRLHEACSQTIDIKGDIHGKCEGVKFFPEMNTYLRVGVSNYNGFSGVEHTKDLQATHLGVLGTNETVIVYTTEKLKQILGIKWWDYIKLDVEGEEYQILDTNFHPMATQVSVEFHEHTHKAIGKENLDALLNHLSRWYHIYNQNWESRHGAGFNYWDILLIAKF